VLPTAIIIAATVNPIVAARTAIENFIARSPQGVAGAEKPIRAAICRRNSLAQETAIAFWTPRSGPSTVD
jgi:hypothetical protein